MGVDGPAGGNPFLSSMKLFETFAVGNTFHCFQYVSQMTITLLGTRLRIQGSPLPIQLKK